MAGRGAPVACRHANPPRPGGIARYMTDAESKAFLDFERAQGVPIPADVPDDALARVRTHAAPDAPALPRPGGRPLVVLSPGFSLPRATLTGLAEDLASRGYVVAAVDHAYESAGTSFPGRLKAAHAVPAVRHAEPASRRRDRRHLGHDVGPAARAAALVHRRRHRAPVVHRHRRPRRPDRHQRPDRAAARCARHQDHPRVRRRVPGPVPAGPDGVVPELPRGAPATVTNRPH